MPTVTIEFTGAMEWEATVNDPLNAIDQNESTFAEIIQNTAGMNASIRFTTTESDPQPTLRTAAVAQLLAQITFLNPEDKYNVWYRKADLDEWTNIYNGKGDFATKEEIDYDILTALGATPMSAMQFLVQVSNHIPGQPQGDPSTNPP